MLSSSTRPRSLPLSAWAAHALDNENLSVDASIDASRVDEEP
jgi:hypothetical protein